MKSDKSIILLGVLMILSYALTQFYASKPSPQSNPMVVQKSKSTTMSDSTEMVANIATNNHDSLISNVVLRK